MITQLRAKSFKSWQDTGDIRIAPLTGFFGTNSSGKTAILQLLLMLKQTVEAVDRQRVLETRGAYVDLGTFSDILHNHQIPGKLYVSVGWKLPNLLEIPDLESEPDRTLFSIPALGFATTIQGTADSISVEEFAYSFNLDGSNYQFGMRRQNDGVQNTDSTSQNHSEYDLIHSGYSLKRNRGRAWPLTPPLKNYRFPDRVNSYYQNASFLSDFVLAFEELFQNLYYLGPLRDDPRRRYLWAGEKPQDVGQRGELAIPALLASRSFTQSNMVEEKVGQALRHLGLISEFNIQPIAENLKDYEVRVRQGSNSSEVSIADVGFGVSQILPVLVLCYYVPNGSTIILEQPEIHLHPSAQTALADIFIDTMKTRNVQIILESHSEHLLRRLQRRVAEEQLTNQDAALYFCQTNNRGISEITALKLDRYGNINNWPDGFFGDELGELAAMTEAGMRRQIQERGS